jgi:molybdopterin-guanine dinucleotide biosynthesis protein A
MRIFGVILAGGQGQRMGGVDKAMVPLAGAPLLAHVIARLEPQVERLALSANGDASRFARFGLPVLPDGQGAGPLAGLLAALRWAAPLGATAVVSAPVDGPFLPGDLCPRLCLAAESAPEGLAVAQAGGRLHPTYGLWPVGLAGPLAAFLDSGAKPKVMDFVDAHGATEAHFADGSGFDNLNTPEDLARAEAVLRGPAG